MNSLRSFILITPAYSYYALYYAPVVMDMLTYFVSYKLSCNYTKVKNKLSLLI
jgi:hypothetical protein